MKLNQLVELALYKLSELPAALLSYFEIPVAVLVLLVWCLIGCM